MPSIVAYNKRLEALKSERSSFIDLWRDCSDYHLRYRGRFLVTDRNKGYQRNLQQYNNTSRLAIRVLSAGMMAGITSPARPWFRLSTGDKDLDELQSVKEWLFTAQQTMYRTFSGSNLYNSLHALYAELGTFGTGAMAIYEDFDKVVRFETFTAGQYMLGKNGRNEIDTFYREFEISIGECVKRYGFENCSETVRQQWNSGNTEQYVKIVHLVEPNDNRDRLSPLAVNMPYRSVHYEYGTTEAPNNKFLRESGFEEFPIATPRWDLTSVDVYGLDCPGITALPDTKALQLKERRHMQAIDKVANPPLQAPSSMRNKVQSQGLRANDILYTDNPNDQITSIYGNYRPDLGAFQELGFTLENRINKAFYVDLFLALTQDVGRQITAREVAERHEEKLLQLGPVLERLHTELLDVLIDRTFAILQRDGLLPPAPDELSGRDLRIEYVSVLAQAQRLTAIGGIEAVSAFAANISGLDPSARHKLDTHQAIDDISDAYGVNPKLVRSDQEAQQLAQAEAQAAAQAQAMAQGQAMADTAKTVSETKIDDNNALGQILDRAGVA